MAKILIGRPSLFTYLAVRIKHVERFVIYYKAVRQLAYTNFYLFLRYQRWLHSLSPSIKKSAWTREEDECLVKLYATHGTRWSAIARNIPGRTDDACSKRYREALDPNLKKDEWTPEEDRKLLEVYSRIGGRWGKVGEEMQRRSGLACRNRSVSYQSVNQCQWLRGYRWRLLERKRTSAPHTEDVFVPHVPATEPVHQDESPGSSDNTPLWPSLSLMTQPHLSQLWSSSMSDFDLDASFLLPAGPDQHSDLSSATSIAYAPPPGPPPQPPRNFNSYPPPLPLRSEDTVTFAQAHSHTTQPTLQSTPSSLSAALDSPDSTPRSRQPSYNPISHMPPRSTEYTPMPHEGYDFSTYSMPNHPDSQPSPESCSAELFSGGTTPVFSDSTPLPNHASSLYHHQHEIAFHSPYLDVSPSPALASDSSVSTPTIATPPTRLNIPLPLPQVSSFTSQSNASGAPSVAQTPISRPTEPFISTPQSERHSIPSPRSPRTPKTPTSNCLSRLEHPTSQSTMKLSSNLAASTE